MNKETAIRKPRTSRKPATPTREREMVGHGGVIDLHAYIAPQVLRTR